MGKIISKKLLSEVLNEELYAVYGSDGKNGLDYIGADTLNKKINIYELAFRVRDYFKLKNKHLSLNQSIGDIFIQANNMYELDTKE